MNPKDYQESCKRTECDPGIARTRFFNYDIGSGGLQTATRLNQALLGLSSELGELSGVVEDWLYHGQPLDNNKIKGELGDCLWYICLACNALGLELSEVMSANQRKLLARYPNGYTDERLLRENRDLVAEDRAIQEVPE